MGDFPHSLSRIAPSRTIRRVSTAVEFMAVVHRSSLLTAPSLAIRQDGTEAEPSAAIRRSRLALAPSPAIPQATKVMAFIAAIRP